MHCYNHISTSKTGRHETTPVWKGLPTQHDSQSGWVLHANVSCHRRLAHYIRAAVWKATVTLDEFEFFPVFNECFYLCLFPSLQAVVCSLCSQMNRMNFERALTTTCTWTHLAVAATSTSSLWLRKQPSASPPRFRCSRINRLIRPPWGECDRCCQHEWETQLREKHTVRIAQCEKATEIVALETESGRDGDNGYMAGGGEENVFFLFFFILWWSHKRKGEMPPDLFCPSKMADMVDTTVPSRLFRAHQGSCRKRPVVMRSPLRGLLTNMTWATPLKIQSSSWITKTRPVRDGWT